MLKSKDGIAHAARFEHDIRSDRTVLSGAAGQRVTIDNGDSGQIHASELVSIDKRQRKADLRGDVEIIRDGLALKSHTVIAKFDVATKTTAGQGKFMDMLRQVACDRDVTLQQQDDTVSCQHLTVDFGPDEDGRNIPKRAHARDNVALVQGSRRMSAREYMDIEFGQLPKDAHGQVVGRSPKLKQLDAAGDVSIVDPRRRWDITGARLKCVFDNDQALSFGNIVGQPGRDAQVQMGEYYIEGPTVTFDDTREWAHVPGRGQARFVITEDLDGRRYARPIPLRVAWQREMVLRGRDDVLLFDGEVVATSDNNQLKSERLRISLKDDIPELASATPKQSMPMGMWFLSPFEAEVQIARRWIGGESDDSSGFSPTYHKKPTYIVAEQSAVLASRSENDQGLLRSRLTLQSDRIAFDLERMVMMTDGGKPGH